MQHQHQQQQQHQLPPPTNRPSIHTMGGSRSSRPNARLFVRLATVGRSWHGNLQGSVERASDGRDALKILRTNRTHPVGNGPKQDMEASRRRGLLLILSSSSPSGPGRTTETGDSKPAPCRGRAETFPAGKMGENGAQ